MLGDLLADARLCHPFIWVVVWQVGWGQWEQCEGDRAIR
jgi:hypothetical protein